MAGTAIRARGVSKRYRAYDSQGARLLHALSPSRSAGVHEVWALRDVDLEVARGETLAIIGRNGSGKSTLLQIITGTLVPTSGEVEAKGRVSALLELGSGFNPEYTGRDNVMMNGLILGLARSEIARRFDEIAAFAEIGDAIDRPVKTYSSGMLMRLAFAVQVLTDPEILVIDEALSVGDFFFQQKCLGYIRSMVQKGVTLVFVSHDMSTVRDLCTRALYLRDGRVAYLGDTPTAIRHYLAERAGNGAAEPAGNGAATAQASEVEAIVRDAAWRAATQDPSPGKLVAVSLHDESGAPASSFRLGGQLVVKVAYRPADHDATHVTAIVRNKFDQLVTCVGSLQLGLTPPPAHDGLDIFEMTLALPLEAGTYSVTINLFRAIAPNQGQNLDSSGAIGPIAITWDYERDRAPFLGMFGPGAHGSFRSAPA